ncbi:CheW-like domain-containing protein [Candidatus Electrothrix laxa]
MSGRIDSYSNLSELLRTIDQEISEVVLEYGDGLKITSDDKQQEIGRHICFDLGDRRLAVPLSLVVEVGELENIRPLPFLPEWVQGVTNIRGEIVSVTDIALYFNISKRSNRKKNRAVIVIHNGEVKTAVIVDRITATRMLYKKEETGEDEKTEQTVLTGFLSGSAVYHSGEKEEMVQLFDGEQLLSSIRI